MVHRSSLFNQLLEELPENVDIVFIGAFTRAAQLSYALGFLVGRGVGAVGTEAVCANARYYDSGAQGAPIF